jgi:hypothetical protein
MLFFLEINNKTSLRRVLNCQCWNENFFAFALDEKSLEDRCYQYWEKYLIALANSLDGELLLEKANLNMFRQSWLEKQFSISCLRRSKRFIPHTSIIVRIIEWMASMPSQSSIPVYEMDEIKLLEEFPESFSPLC